jgi:hypothetical protein
MEEWKSKHQTEGSRYLEKQEEPQADGTKIERSIYKRRFVGPLLLIERKLDANGTILAETKMAAEYLIVQLSAGESAETFVERLRDDFPDNSFKIEKLSTKSSLYRLDFQPSASSATDPTARLNLFTKIKKVIEDKKLAADCYPSTLLKLASSPIVQQPGAVQETQRWHLMSDFGINPPVELFNQNNPAIPSAGDPIRIAVLDSGIRDTHQAFKGKIVTSEDEVGDIFYGYSKLN